MSGKLGFETRRCGKQATFPIIAGQEFDRAEPVLLLLPVWLQIIFAVSSHDRQISQISGSLRQKLAVQGRYKVNLFLCVLTGSLQGVAERPLPCSYNVIRLVCFHGGNTGSNPVGDAKSFQ